MADGGNTTATCGFVLYPISRSWCATGYFTRIGFAYRCRRSMLSTRQSLGISMATRRTRNSTSLAAKSMEVALAVPQVVAHRVTRMALAGPTLSERDRREFQMMVNEK